MKHTPGPWTVKTLENGQQTVLDANGDCACVKTNAHLIASAPDLLAALQAILARVDKPGGSIASIRGEDIAQVRSAIAKAQA